MLADSHRLLSSYPQVCEVCPLDCWPYKPVCKMWQGARQDFRGRQNPAPNRDAKRPSATQFLPPNGIIVPGAAHFPSFSHLCPKISQSCPDFCPDRDSCPDEISLKPATFFRLAYKAFLVPAQALAQCSYLSQVCGIRPLPL